jgi:hypothetical protein
MQVDQILVRSNYKATFVLGPAVEIRNKTVPLMQTQQTELQSYFCTMDGCRNPKQDWTVDADTTNFLATTIIHYHLQEHHQRHHRKNIINAIINAMVNNGLGLQPAGATGVRPPAQEPVAATTNPSLGGNGYSYDARGPLRWQLMRLELISRTSTRRQVLGLSSDTGPDREIQGI